VELEDGFKVGRVACEARVGGDVLACVVAFTWAVPEQEAAVYGFEEGSMAAVVSRWGRR